MINERNILKKRCNEELESLEGRCKKDGILAVACAEKLVFLRVAAELINRDDFRISAETCEILISKQCPLDYLYTDQVTCDLYQVIKKIICVELERQVCG